MRDRDLERIESRIDILRKREGTRDRRRIEAEVFDRSTLMTVYKLFQDRVIDTIEFPISTGKEAVVFSATTSRSPPGIEDTGWAAVKIYRISNAEFRNLYRYIDGDPRFEKVKRDLRSIIYAWSRKEYKNLLRSADAGVRVPHAFASRRNVLVMELVAEDGSISPMLKGTSLDDVDEFYMDVLDQIRTLFRKARLVHADLSEYNILVRDGKPVLIDMGQAVVLEHPHAREFLERDVANLVRYFGKLGVDCDEKSVMAAITGRSEESLPREPAHEHGDPGSRRPEAR